MTGGDGFLIPPARDFSMVVNAASRVYSYRFDEAMRDNRTNALATRRDTFVRALMEERLLPTINRKWQLKVPNDKDPRQVFVRDGLKRQVEAIPKYNAFQRALLDGTWFGRAGTTFPYVRRKELGGAWGIKKWDSVHGDSIQYTYDGTPAILMDSMTAGWYANHGATTGPLGDVRPTDRGGMALVLQRPYWRDRYAIHQHILEKADFFEGELAGSVQGLGLRGLVYWHYVVRTDALTWMLAYMQSVGQMDLLVFNYPAGNDQAMIQQTANARKIIGKAAIACPRNPAGNWPAIEQIPMNTEGLKALHSLISEYFDRHIERLIVGQSMSSGADNESGLGGSGRAQFAKSTKDEILTYDTNRRDETMTTDVVDKLKSYNYPWADFPVTYESILPDLESKDKVESGTKLISAGITIKADEMRSAANFTRPEIGDEVVGGQQMMGMGGPPGANPNFPMHVAPAMGRGGPAAPPMPAPPRPGGMPPQRPPQLPQRPPGQPPVRNMAMPGGGNTYIPQMQRPTPARRPQAQYDANNPVEAIAALIEALNAAGGTPRPANRQAIAQAIQERGLQYFDPNQPRATDGKFGTGGGSGGGGSGASSGGGGQTPTRPRAGAQAPRDTSGNLASLAQEFPQEARQPGFWNKVKAIKQRVGAAVMQWAVAASPYIMPIAEALLDTPQDFQKFGYVPTVSGMDANSPDPLKATMGVSFHLAASIVSKAVPAALAALKRRKLARMNPPPANPPVPSARVVRVHANPVPNARIRQLPQLRV